jgi:hypothetical protein
LQRWKQSYKLLSKLRNSLDLEHSFFLFGLSLVDLDRKKSKALSSCKTFRCSMSFPTFNLLIIKGLLIRIYATVNAVRGLEMGKLFAVINRCAQLYTLLVVIPLCSKFLCLGLGGNCISQTQCIIFIINQNGLPKPETTPVIQIVEALS